MKHRRCERGGLSITVRHEEPASASHWPVTFDLGADHSLLIAAYPEAPSEEFVTETHNMIRSHFGLDPSTEFDILNEARTAKCSLRQLPSGRYFVVLCKAACTITSQTLYKRLHATVSIGGSGVFEKHGSRLKLQVCAEKAVPCAQTHTYAVALQVTVRIASSPDTDYQQTRLMLRLEPQPYTINSKQPEIETRTLAVTTK